MNALTVSVALCTHNGAEFFGEQLHSILLQSLHPAEVVISDDASTDETLDIAEGFRRRFSEAGINLTLLRNATPLKVVANFERAVLACTGDYIALADQDDVWHPDRLLKLTKRLDSKPEIDLVFSDARLVDAHGVELGHTLFDSLEISPRTLQVLRADGGFGVLLRRNLVTGATVMFRSSLLERAVPFEPSWVHDEWLAIIAAAHAAVDYVPETLIDYRQHHSNVIGITVPTLRRKVSRVFEKRGDRYIDLVERSDRLVQRLIQLGASPPVIELARGKLAHQKARANLAQARPARISAIVREAASGKYRKFSSQGNLDILRDLLQPA
jgi:glycosyltransferase involved in cell wall biosynthesis